MALLDWLWRLFRRSPAPSPGVSPFAPGTGPSRLILLRHAEKTGDRSDPHLSLAGRQRAERLPAYITATFVRPQFLIAARTSQRSRRPAETLEPLAAALSLDIKAKYDDSEVDDLVEALRDKKRYQGASGVICWRHSDLPRLAVALGAPQGSYPSTWDPDDYTTVVDVTYAGEGTVAARQSRMPF